MNAADIDIHLFLKPQSHIVTLFWTYSPVKSEDWFLWMSINPKLPNHVILLTQIENIVFTPIKFTFWLMTLCSLTVEIVLNLFFNLTYWLSSYFNVSRKFDKHVYIQIINTTGWPGQGSMPIRTSTETRWDWTFKSIFFAYSCSVSYKFSQTYCNWTPVSPMYS